jgi:putative addiction module killer protein
MKLPDLPARAAVLRRIDRLEKGNFGDHRFLGEGVWELKIDLGPGYRVYCAQEGKTIILLLCAGSKRSQRRDIVSAIAYWNEYRSRS